MKGFGLVNAIVATPLLSEEALYVVGQLKHVVVVARFPGSGKHPGLSI